MPILIFFLLILLSQQTIHLCIKLQGPKLRVFIHIMNMMDTENASPASFKTKYIYLLHGNIPLSLAQYPQILAYQK